MKKSIYNNYTDIQASFYNNIQKNQHVVKVICRNKDTGKWYQYIYECGYIEQLEKHVFETEWEEIMHCIDCGKMIKLSNKVE